MMRWPWKTSGKQPVRKPAGQQSIRQFLESGNWGENVKRNTPVNADHPRYRAAMTSHEDALTQVDELLTVVTAQQHLLDLFIDLGDETAGGVWIPKN